MDLVPAGDKAFFKAEATGRVTCTLNGHTFPALEEPIRAFIRSASLRPRRGPLFSSHCAKRQRFISVSHCPMAQRLKVPAASGLG